MTWSTGSDDRPAAPGHAGSPPGDRGALAIRQFWFLLLGLAGSVVMIGVVLAIATGHGPSNAALHVDHLPHVSTGALALALVGLGVVTLAAARALDRPLDGTSDAALVASFKRRFFLWVGLSEVPTFVGVALVALTARFALYPVGALFAFIGYARIAPTKVHLARDQERLDRAHQGRSLLNALGTVPAQSNRWR